VLFSVKEYVQPSTRSGYDMTADDQRFVMIRELPHVDEDLVIVQNFFEELKQRAPN